MTAATDASRAPARGVAANSLALSYRDTPLRLAMLAELAALHRAAGEARAPCTTSDAPERWTSDDPADLDAAAALCDDCPIQWMCSAFGRKHHPTGGQWGAYRHRPLTRTTTTPKEAP